MKLTRSVLVTMAACLTALASAFAAGNMHMGTWKLDEAKSKLSPGSPKNETVTYSAGEKGMVNVTVEGVDKDGKTIHWTWSGKFDGKPHKVEGSEGVDAIALKMVNDRTNSMSVMKDGKVIQTGKIEVSKDGKSRVVTATMTDAKGAKQSDKAYYNKQ